MFLSSFDHPPSMGLLDRIFGKNQVQDGPQDMRLDEIDALLKRELEGAARGIEGRLQEIEEEIIAEAGEILEILQEIEGREFPEEIEKRIYKPVKTARPRYVKGMRKAVEGIRTTAPGAGLDGHKEFQKKVVAALKFIEKIQRGDGRYLALVFEEEIVRIGTHLNRILDSVQQLGQTMEDLENRIGLIREAMKVKDDVDRLGKGILEAREGRASLKDTLAEGEGKVAEIQGELESFVKGQEYLKLVELEARASRLQEEMAGIKSQVFSSLGSLGRLLRKYQRVVEGTDHEEATVALVQDPVVFFLRGGNPAPVLEGVKKSLEEGLLKLKEKEMKRTFPKVEKALGVDYPRLLMTYRERKAELEKITAEMESSPAARKKAQLELELEASRKRLEALRQEPHRMVEEIKEMESQYQEKIRELESLLGEILEREVTLDLQEGPP
jgi:predicted  nucleic acid-binding Zn-ribbon protein